MAEDVSSGLYIYVCDHPYPNKPFGVTVQNEMNVFIWFLLGDRSDGMSLLTVGVSLFRIYKIS